MEKNEGVLRGTKMVKYVVTPEIPAHFLFVVDCDSQTENLEFMALEEQDSILFTWLLSIILDSLFSRFFLMCTLMAGMGRHSCVL